MSETSKSIAEWQKDTFGANQLTTVQAIIDVRSAMNDALSKARDFIVADDGGQGSANLSRAIRAAREMAELISLLAIDDEDPKAPVECSDIEIVLAGIYAAHNVERQDVTDAKMAKNRKRRWQVTGDGHGQHVPTEGDGL